MSLSSLELFNVNCEGEIGDVVISGDFDLKGDTLLEQSNTNYNISYFSLTINIK
jgi:proline racemase